MNEFMIFSERLKLAMKHNNKMKQSELAEITGLTEVTISRYVNGQRTPKAHEIVKLAKALNTSCDYLLGVSEDMNGEKIGTISVEKALRYCEECANNWSDFGKRALENIGHGDSHTSSFGAVAYGAQQEDMYRYNIPRVIRALSTLN